MFIDFLSTKLKIYVRGRPYLRELSELLKESYAHSHTVWNCRYLKGCVCSLWDVKFSELERFCRMLLALDCQSLGEIIGRMADDHCRISSLTIYPLEHGFFHFGNQMYFLLIFFYGNNDSNSSLKGNILVGTVDRSVRVGTLYNCIILCYFWRFSYSWTCRLMLTFSSIKILWWIYLYLNLCISELFLRIMRNGAFFSPEDMNFLKFLTIKS